MSQRATTDVKVLQPNQNNYVRESEGTNPQINKSSGLLHCTILELCLRNKAPHLACLLER
jgi:hypothetical protein